MKGVVNMKKALRIMTLALSAVFAVGNLTMLTDAQSSNLAERISEETVIWGNHTIFSDVFTEIEDPTILPESKRDSVDAIRVEDRMCGLAFRVNGALPEKAGNYNIHYFQDYFPYNQNQYDMFEADSAGCFIASYAYYESYLENMFPVPEYREEPIEIRYTDGDEVALSDTDSVVILMLGQYPSDVQSDAAAEEAYYLDVEQAILSCGQFSYIGEARRIEQTFYYNMDGLDIVCTDADAAAEMLESDLLAPYSAKHILNSNPCAITLPELLTEEARELRALVRQDERVVSAQIDYSFVTDAGADAVMNGIFTSDHAAEVQELEKGDIDGDGEVTVADAQLVLDAYAQALVRNPIELTDEQVERSHVLGLEKEGTLDGIDAQIILQYSVKKLAGYTDEELKDFFANIANRLTEKSFNGVSYICK